VVEGNWVVELNMESILFIENISSIKVIPFFGGVPFFVYSE